MSTSGFEFVTKQIQWIAEIGQVDGGGMGRMDFVEEFDIFPSREKADEWIKSKGWVWDKRLYRMVNPNCKNGYGMTQVRRREEGDESRWV